MNTYEAKGLLLDSLRCLARSMEQIRIRETEKCMGRNEPMQDFLAQCAHTKIPYGGSSVKDCLEYLKSLYDGLEEASKHQILENKIAKQFHYDYDLTNIADMVRGSICHDYPDNLLVCANEIEEWSKQFLPGKDRYMKCEIGCERAVKAFLEKAEKTIKKYKEQTWEEGSYSLPLAYLANWMRRMYWEG